MDFNRIDMAGIGGRTGWGSIWQGGTVDAAVATLPGPLLIVTMDRGEVDDQFIDHAKEIDAVLAVWIDDSPDAVLSDTVLRMLVRTVKGWLEAGGNVYDHCAAGVSRASYMDIAIHMHVLGWTYQAAFDFVHQQRPVASPNPGFIAQLQRLSGQL